MKISYEKYEIFFERICKENLMNKINLKEMRNIRIKFQILSKIN